MPWMDFILLLLNRLPRTSTAKWGLTHEHWLCLLFEICWKVKLPVISNVSLSFRSCQCTTYCARNALNFIDWSKKNYISYFRSSLDKDCIKWTQFTRCYWKISSSNKRRSKESSWDNGISSVTFFSVISLVHEGEIDIAKNTLVAIVSTIWPGLTEITESNAMKKISRILLRFLVRVALSRFKKDDASLRPYKCTTRRIKELVLVITFVAK